jgi:hypothetical protein
MYNEEKNTELDNILDEVLKAEPKFVLPDDFADTLAQKMARKIAWEQYLLEFLIYFGAIVGLVVVSAAIQFVFFGAQWQVWLQFIAGNIFILSGIALLLVFILFIDRVLLRYFLHRTSFAGK